MSIEKNIEACANLMADMLQETRQTNELLASLVLALSGKLQAARADTAKAIETAKSAAAYAEQKAIHAEPPEQLELNAPASEQPTTATTDIVIPVSVLDYAAVAKVVTTLSNAKGREAASAVLKRFGAKNLKEVAAEQFSAVVAACEEALA